MGKYVIVFLFLIPSLSFSQQTLPGFNDRYVTMEDGVRLYVTKVGQGEPVIVLHGGWDATYNYLINPLNPFFDRYHFIFYNQRGSHKSVAPDSTVSLQQFVEDLENIRQEIGANNVTLLSHGIGSNLAYAYLKNHPDHVSGLILVAPKLPTGFKKDESKNLKEMKAIQKRLRHLASKEQKELKEEGLYRKDNYSAEEDSAFRRIGFAALLIYHIERWRQIEDGATFSLTKDIPKLMSENTSQKLKNNFWATLKNHPKPIEVIIGDHPKFPSDWNNIAAKLPYLELQKIDKAGYHIWIDQPKKFESSMGEALNRATN